ncbi:N-formylglutamate deformylase [Vibrio sp. YIC-376]|uniref:N-formylglutamate deformylase n=1 Tax=Vibrio sp. YIC-376 TaxID=3136162 RepID=UPI00402A752A
MTQPTIVSSPFEFHQGNVPLLVSMPHSGLNLTPEVEQGLTDAARHLPDTDWFIPELYECVKELGASVISANYSRYVIDLNRPFDDKPLYTTKTTGLFPEILFDSTPVFFEGKAPTEADHERYKQQIWQPYHLTIEQELARLKEIHGYAILFDAHSIAAQVPMLFEGTLPDFNWGTNQGESCSSAIVDAVMETVSDNYSQVLNGRFKGGFITRGFGNPSENIHAIQLEMSQDTYLNNDALALGRYELDAEKSAAVKSQLKAILSAVLNTKI